MDTSSSTCVWLAPNEIASHPRACNNLTPPDAKYSAELTANIEGNSNTISAPPITAHWARSNLENMAGVPRCTKSPLITTSKVASGYFCRKPSSWCACPL